MINDKHISAPVVFIYIGKKLPSYLKHSIEFAEKNTINDIYFLTNCRTKKIGNRTKFIQIDITILSDRKHFTSSDVNAFRDGFWNKTIERYGVLYNFMKTYEITRLFHIELDNLIISLEGIDHHLDSLNKGMFFPTNTLDKIGFGSFIYINKISSLEKFVRFTENNKNKNDMELLGMYHEKTRNVLSFDINEALANFKRSEISRTIIDGAMFGQYIFGYDPKNTFGIIRNKVFSNPTSLASLNGKYGFYNNKIYLNKDSYLLEFANLHIHSKIFKHISISKKLNKLILAANLEQRIIHIDYWIFFKSISLSFLRRLRISSI